MNKMAHEIWILSAKRTPFGTLSGALKDISAIDLAAASSTAALSAASVSAEDIDQVVLGNVQQTSPDAIYGARHVGLKAGVPIDRPALTVNRLCGSGFQAVITAAEQILLGEAHCVLAAGSENMSQAPHVMYGLRDGGAKFGKPPVVSDSLWDALTDSFCKTPMGMTAENLAVDYKISREDADAYALQSQQRFAAAQKSGAFAAELISMTVRAGRKEIVFDRDEHPREATVEGLAKLPAVFKKEGVVTAGNASGICDGAASLVVCSAEWGKKNGKTPLARLVNWASVGVRPTHMGIGPAPAIRKALGRSGLSLGDVDLFDVNEAFAPQFLAVCRELELDPAKVNVNGGAIAVGHPLGASGARITANLIHTLRARKARYGVGSACIGGGQGIAVVLEAL